MKKYKRISKSKLDKMSAAERKAYYKNAVEHYGNLENQLKGFKLKNLIHPLLLLITHFFPVKVINLNDIDWGTDGLPIIFSANHSNSNDFPVLVQSIKKHCFALADTTL